MDKPQKPQESDCCGSGCTPCIFDVYEQQIKLWETSFVTQTDVKLLNPVKYSPFRIVGLEKITKDTNLYTFQALDETLSPINLPIILKMGDYAILKATFLNDQNIEEKISRPYTIILNDFLKTGRFQVIIKLYPGGKMSTFLGKLTINDDLYWRGPYNHFTNKVTSHVILLGAGTGVVPLYNIAKEMTLDENCETLINLVGCFQSLDCVLLRDELNELTRFWNCKVEYYVSDTENKSQRYNEHVFFHKFDKHALQLLLVKFKVDDVFVVVCGSDTFNSFYRDAVLAIGVHKENVVIL